MDIKDFILIGGGILIIMVIGHGFWLAWRAKREPLRLDIVPDLIPDDVDEMERLRGELPNGGARVRNRRAPRPEPENLELDLLVTEPARDSVGSEVDGQASPGKVTTGQQQVAKANTASKARQAPPRKPVGEDDLLTTQTRTPAVVETTPARVREVSLVSESRVNAQQKPSNTKARASSTRERKPAVESPEPATVSAVEELLIINLLAPRGQRFQGEALVTALRAQGLRYGEMNIFHRVDPATKAKLYSVANAVEPGTFDLADLEALQSPGMTFFLQLPGPDDALGVFNDMLEAARNVAQALGGELRDEDLSVMTGQTTEHMRQRIADFSRRRLFKRA